MIDPTPEQIKKACEEIKKKWTTQEEIFRSGNSATWEIPHYSVHIRICARPGNKKPSKIWKRI